VPLEDPLMRTSPRLLKKKSDEGHKPDTTCEYFGSWYHLLWVQYWYMLDVLDANRDLHHFGAVE